MASIKLLLANDKVEGIRYYETYRKHGGYTSVEKALNTLTPDEVTEEVKKIVLSSELSKRCKEVILEKIRHPNMTLEQLGHILGVTKQCVSFHLISAEQYFKSQDIFIDV